MDTSEPRNKFAMSTEFLKDAEPIQAIFNSLLSERQTQLDRINAEIVRLIKHAPVWANVINDTLSNFAASYADIIRYAAKAKILDAAGLLPGPTTPWELLSADLTSDEARKIVLDFYEQTWADASERMYESVIGYDIDSETKDAFGEALQAHGAGLYRSVVRMLMCEIERTVRVNLYDNELGSRFPKEFIEVLGKLPAGSILQYDGGLELYQRISPHLYANISTDEDRKRSANTLIPNRHAAVHGLIVYERVEHSLNAIMMANFLFHQVATTKRLLEHAPDRRHVQPAEHHLSGLGPARPS